eukprot:435857_1
MKYDRLRIFTSYFLTFKSNIININVILSEFKKFHGTAFGTLKIIVNNFIFIILWLKHIVYSLVKWPVSTRHAPAAITIGSGSKVKNGKCPQSYEEYRHQIKNYVWIDSSITNSQSYPDELEIQRSCLCRRFASKKRYYYR